MPWDVKYLTGEKVITVTATGPVSTQDARQQAEEAVKLSRETHATRALVDFYEAQTKFDSLDVYVLPEFFKYIGMPRQAPIAVVQPKGRHRNESYRFFENVCHNNGFNVKVCDTVPEARSWLKGQAVRQGSELDASPTD
jgi:hypothetical protein